MCTHKALLRICASNVGNQPQSGHLGRNWFISAIDPERTFLSVGSRISFIQINVDGRAINIIVSIGAMR
jgi:hypothetical protein